MSIKSFKKVISKTYKKGKLTLFHLKKTRVTNTYTKKRIIICFNGVLPHGGLVDRLKGIISFYEISKILDYDFYIQFDNPFNLSSLLEPNLVSWNIDKKEVVWYPFKTKLIYLVNNFDANPLKIIKQSNANTFFVYSNIDYLAKLYPKAKANEVEAKWRINFNELFKKSELLNNKLKVVENEKYISFHTRFTSLMGDFVDSSLKIISEQEKEALLVKLEGEVEKIKNNKYKCYAFSDSIRFLKYIKEKKKISIVEGDPFHMDNFNKDSTLEAHLKTMIDFFMIANSETVYFIKVGKMYSSSFSKYASIVGNKPFTIITS